MFALKTFVEQGLSKYFRVKDVLDKKCGGKKSTIGFNKPNNNTFSHIFQSSGPGMTNLGCKKNFVDTRNSTKLGRTRAENLFLCTYKILRIIINFQEISKNQKHLIKYDIVRYCIISYDTMDVLYEFLMPLIHNPDPNQNRLGLYVDNYDLYA